MGKLGSLQRGLRLKTEREKLREQADGNYQRAITARQEVGRTLQAHDRAWIAQLRKRATELRATEALKALDRTEVWLNHGDHTLPERWQNFLKAIGAALDEGRDIAPTAPQSTGAALRLHAKSEELQKRPPWMSNPDSLPKKPPGRS